MKKSLFFMIFALLLAISYGCSNGDTDGDASSSSSPQSLTASTGYPPSDGSVDTFALPLIEHVVENSDEIDIETFTGGELFGEDESLSALESQSIDIEMVLSPTLDPSRFPYSSVIALPLLESNAQIAAEAVQNLMTSDVEISDGKTYYELEFTDKNLFALPIHPTETYLLSTVDNVFESVDNLTSSVRMRASSNVHETFIQELGLSPVALPATEIYDGLSRGSLDGAMLNVPDWPPYGVDEATNFTISGVSLGHFPVFFAMNDSTWESLSGEVQDLFQNKADELIQEGPQIYMEQRDEILEKYTNNGKEVINYSDLDEDVQSTIDSAILSTWESFISDLDNQGHNGTAIATLWRDLIIEAGGEVPKEVMDL